jgi:hypothetical protein
MVLWLVIEILIVYWIHQVKLDKKLLADYSRKRIFMCLISQKNIERLNLSHPESQLVAQYFVRIRIMCISLIAPMLAFFVYQFFRTFYLLNELL